MAKKKDLKWFLNFLFMLAGSIGVIGVGTLFTGGSFLTSTLLSWIPEVGHTIVGWVLIVAGGGGIIPAIASLFK